MQGKAAADFHKSGRELEEEEEGLAALIHAGKSNINASV